MTKPTTPITDKGLTLLHMPSRRIACVGDVVLDFRGNWRTITGGRAPLNPRSSGRVWLETDNGDVDFYPTNVRCQWVQL